MRPRLAIFVLLVVVAVPCAAQVTVRNPQNLPVSKQEAEVLLRVTCDTVAREFRVSDPRDLSLPVTLVLGEQSGDYSRSDDVAREYTIYMTSWDRTRFASSTLRLVLLRVLNSKQHRQMMEEIMGRADHILPVRAQALRKK